MVEVEKCQSDPFYPTAGVPQGSVVAPGLFLIHVSKPPTGQCQISQYADDIALYYQSSNVGLAIEKLRQGAEILTSWLDTNKIGINHSKSKFLLFTNKRTAGALTITIKNTEIKQEKDVKFLGMTINKQLNWNTHIKEITKKVAPKMATLKILAQLKMYRAHFFPEASNQPSLQPTHEDSLDNTAPAEGRKQPSPRAVGRKPKGI